MLGSEYFRGRQQHRLTTCRDDVQHRANRNYGLSTSHITLQQPLHRYVTCKVARDLGADFALPFSESEGQRGVEGLAQRRSFYRLHTGPKAARKPPAFH